MPAEARLVPERCHTAIRVRDLEKVLAFYRDLVGLPVLRTAGEPERPSAVWLPALQLVRDEGVGGGGAFDHTGLAVSNVDEIVARLQAAGAAFDQPLRDMTARAGQPARACFVRDPEGNRLELIEYGSR